MKITANQAERLEALRRSLAMDFGTAAKTLKQSAASDLGVSIKQLDKMLAAPTREPRPRLSAVELLNLAATYLDDGAVHTAIGLAEQALDIMRPIRQQRIDAGLISTPLPEVPKR